VGDEGLGREGFRERYGCNPFVDTRRDRFSTFGMDVDPASYTYARNQLRAGRLPRPETVRVEEFVNYFPEEYAADPDTVFSVFCEGGPSPFGEGLELLKIGVKARELKQGERKNAVLTFAVDTSGSMAGSVRSEKGKQIDTSGASRLALVRQALRTLVEALGPDDRVGLIAYNTHPYLVLPHTAARERSRILGAIAALEPGGATNVQAGLDLTYRVAYEVFEPKALNRVILCSDGVANVGARGPDAILKKVSVFAGRGIYLSCVGFGMGRYNDAMLETLANKGNGNYAYVDSVAEADRMFRRNLPATLQVLAQDAKIQVNFNPAVVSHYRLLGYENRDIRDEDFRNDTVDAGEVGPGSLVTVLYEIRRRTNPQGDIGRIFLRYRDTGTGRIDEVNYPLSPGVLATRLDETTDRFRFIAACAETAELLRNNYWARDGSYAGVLGLLAGLSPAFREQPAWRDLAEVAARAQALAVRSLAKNLREEESKL
jgi:Ca-activated chloride channel family protein